MLAPSGVGGSIGMHKPVARADDVDACAADIFRDDVADFDPLIDGHLTERLDDVDQLRLLNLAIRSDADDRRVGEDCPYARGQRAHRVRELGDSILHTALALLSAATQLAVLCFTANSAAVRANDAYDFCCVHCTILIHLLVPPNESAAAGCRPDVPL